MFDFNFSLLKAKGFVVGPRDFNMNRAFEGRYMVAEPYEPGTVQDDAQGGDGVWCIVGHDLDKLCEEAVSFFELQAEELRDWEGVDPEPSRYVTTKEDDQVSLTFEDGTTVWVEKQEGRIRVHCFCAPKDEPVNVEIYGDRIEVDLSDYLHA